MTSERGNTGVDSKKQQTVHVGALAKIVVCLVVNIFLLGPGEEI